MSALKQAAMSVCFTAVAIGIIEILMPKNSFKASMRLITGSVLLISMMSPFLTGFKPDFDFEPKAFDYSMSDSVRECAAIAVKDSIAAVIKQYDVEYAKIEINMDNSAADSIVINQAVIYFYPDDMDKAEKIVKQVRNKLEINAVISEIGR